MRAHFDAQLGFGIALEAAVGGSDFWQVEVMTAGNCSTAEALADWPGHPGNYPEGP